MKRLAKFLLDHVGASIATAVVAALVTPLAIQSSRDWLLASIPLPRVVPIALVLLAVGLGWLLYRQRTPAVFQPFRVHEQGMGVFWWIQQPTHAWITDAFGPYPNTRTGSLLDGPFCASKRTNGEHCLGRFISKATNDSINAECDTCERNALAALLGPTNSLIAEVPLPELKLRVLRTLQDADRNGVKVRKGMTFKILAIDTDRNRKPPPYG